MNTQITIQAPTSTQDTYGQAIVTWADITALTNLWCSMITTGGREFYAAQKLHAETQVVFKLRHQPGIEVTNRVRYGSRYFCIMNVNNVNEKFEYLLLSCKEVL